MLSQIQVARGGDDDIEMEDESSSSDEEVSPSEFLLLAILSQHQ